MTIAKQRNEATFSHDREDMQGTILPENALFFGKNRQKTVDCGLNLLYAVQPSPSDMFTYTDV